MKKRSEISINNIFYPFNSEHKDAPQNNLFLTKLKIFIAQENQELFKEIMNEIVYSLLNICEQSKNNKSDELDNEFAQHILIFGTTGLGATLGKNPFETNNKSNNSTNKIENIISNTEIEQYFNQNIYSYINNYIESEFNSSINVQISNPVEILSKIFFYLSDYVIGQCIIEIETTTRETIYHEIKDMIKF